MTVHTRQVIAVSCFEGNSGNRKPTIGAQFMCGKAKAKYMGEREKGGECVYLKLVSSM